jgi:hypothetical protein
VVRRREATPTLFGPADLGVPTDGWVCLRCGTVWPADVFPCPIDGSRGWAASGPLHSSAIGTTQYGPTPGREYQWYLNPAGAG